MTMFFWLCYGNNEIFWKLPMEFIASSLHRFYAVFFFWLKREGNGGKFGKG
jgi:succinate dehydrogenase/fumarate reductase cytochrome b subunit